MPLVPKITVNVTINFASMSVYLVCVRYIWAFIYPVGSTLQLVLKHAWFQYSLISLLFFYSMALWYVHPGSLFSNYFFSFLKIRKLVHELQEKESHCLRWMQYGIIISMANFFSLKMGVVDFHQL